MASDFTWIGRDWQEVESVGAVYLSACLYVLREAWCACEQTEITSFALHLLSFSCEQTLVITSANTQTWVLEIHLS